MGILQDLLKEVPLSSVLRERVQLAEDRLRHAEEENEALRLRVGELEKENSALRDSFNLHSKNAAGSRASVLEPDTARVLGYLVNADDRDARTPSVMSRELGLKRPLVQFQLDQLKAQGLVSMPSSNYNTGDTFWVPTISGRKLAVESGLVS